MHEKKSFSKPVAAKKKINLKTQGVKPLPILPEGNHNHSSKKLLVILGNKIVN